MSVDFRLVSASLRELDRLIHEQGFREDLYYRINGMRVVIAPLRERQDIPELIKKLLQQLSPNEPKQLSSEAMRAVAGYRWPGNVRQLQQALKVAAILGADSPCIEIDHFSPDLQQVLRPCISQSAPSTLQAIEWDVIQNTLRQYNGNMSATAKA
ncbi:MULTISPECIES: sigma 54-interacting transcriptional regulator [Pseudomonas putida group]|uniref:sigma 54-interacting transcriptional regulator n=1 Tax=Pseudomonas putida group TaxID=136845 RepID=UPI002FBD945B